MITIEVQIWHGKDAWLRMLNDETIRSNEMQYPAWCFIGNSWAEVFTVAPDAPLSLLLLGGLSSHNARNKIYQRICFEPHM